MGRSYTNITCIDCEVEDLIDYLHEDDIASFVVPVKGGIIVFPAADEAEDEQTLNDIGARLSAAAECMAVTVLNHDEAFLAVGVYEQGDERAACNTDPDYFTEVESDPVTLMPEADEDELDDEPFEDDDEEAEAQGLPREQALEQAEAIVDTISPDAAVDAVAGALSDPDFVLASERHEALVEELSLPREAVGIGYADIAEDPGSIDFDASAAMRVS